MSPRSRLQVVLTALVGEVGEIFAPPPTPPTPQWDRQGGVAHYNGGGIGGRCPHRTPTSHSHGTHTAPGPGQPNKTH